MKKIYALLFASLLLVTMSTSAFAVELPDGDILGYWKLDASLANEAGGPDAEFNGFAFEEGLLELEDYTWVEGVDGGYAWKAQTLLKDGIKFAAPTSQSMTMMLWVKADNCPLTTPLLWWGEQDQSNALGLGGEAWIGIWPEFNDNWGAVGPCIGSNNAAGDRVAVHPTENPFTGTTLPWTHIAVSIEYDEATGLSYGRLYYNGQLAGEGGDLPFVQSPDAYVYFGVNPWNWPIDGYIDEIIIYNEVLTDDEIAGIFSQYETPSEDVVEAFPFGVETEAPETDPETTEAPDEETTSAPEVTDTPKTEAPKEDGCGSSMGIVSVIVTLVSVIGVAVIKRNNI